MKKSNMSGFTLVEVAIVAVIGGILLVSSTSLLQIYIKKTEQRITQTRIDEIDEAIQRFLNTNGRYPCPAALADIPETATFGVEGTNCSTTVGSFITGAVPTRTLNLPDNTTTDAWGNKFSYTVTPSLATDGGYNVNGGELIISDSNGNRIIPRNAGGPSLTNPGAHYVVLSHGGNQFGATNLSGNVVSNCMLGGNNERVNCTANRNFVSTLLLSDAFGPNAYDDYIRYREIPSNNAFVPFGGVMFFDVAAYPIDCPVGWVTPATPIPAPAGLRSCLKR